MSPESARRKKKIFRLPHGFYTRSDTLLIARELLGKRLVVPAPDKSRVSGWITETEAYMAPEDKASHAYNNRRTRRTEIMFAPGGRAYVYLVYGMYYGFNVVTNKAEIPHAVLIRALEPDEGIEWMRRRRVVEKDSNLASGPGKLCQAMGLGLTYNGTDLTGESVWIEDAGKSIPPEEILSGGRIGINYAEEYVEKPWRFWLRSGWNT